jgi:DNA-binding NarL/FixJ family response regulator
LVDDHALFREGLSLLIQSQSDWHILGEAADGETGVRLARELQPDIVMLDIEMPTLNGIAAAPRLLKAAPAARIIALSTYGDSRYRERMFAAGASAFVLKNEAMDDLLKAVDAVLRGERFVSPAIEDASAYKVRSTTVELEWLTEREIEVLRLVADGLRSKDIGQQLGISERTVETYRARIMLKLNITTLPGLVKFALNAGLTEPGP